MGCNNSLPVADEFLVPHTAPTNEYGSGLVSKERLVLKVKEKFFSFRGDFTVTDQAGEPFCKVHGTYFSMRQRVVIKDLDGKPIACVLGKILSISPAMFIYGVKPYYEGQQPTSEKEDGLPLYAWAKVWNPVTSMTPMYMIQMAKGDDEYTSATYETCDYKSWAPGVAAPRLSVVKGADKTKGGCCLIDRSTLQFESANVYDVTIAPGIDPILMIGLVICKDAIQERN